MATPNQGSSLQRPLRFDADFLVCRRLHVEEDTTFNGNVTIIGNLTADDIFCHNLTATQTVTSNALVTTTATIPTIVGVLTINGQPYPPTSTGGAGGPTVDVANGAVFPTLVVPAGGTGAYRVTNASLSGMANNAPDPGPGNGGPGGAGLARITGFSGDIAGRTELLLFNASSYVLRFFTPIVSINPARGRVWFPGTRARATRASTSTPTWVVEVDDMRFTSSMLQSTPDIASRVVLPPGSNLDNGQIEYSMRSFGDSTTDDVLVEMTGIFAVLLDRTGNPASNTGTVELRRFIGDTASAAWSGLAGFLPSFGTLDALGVAAGGEGAFALLPYRHVGTGHIVNQITPSAIAYLRDDSISLNIEMTGIAGLTSVIAIVPFHFTYQRYEFVPTF